jgi:hypothetical protein
MGRLHLLRGHVAAETSWRPPPLAAGPDLLARRRWARPKSGHACTKRSRDKRRQYLRRHRRRSRMERRNGRCTWPEPPLNGTRHARPHDHPALAERRRVGVRRRRDTGACGPVPSGMYIGACPLQSRFRTPQPQEEGSSAMDASRFDRLTRHLAGHACRLPSAGSSGSPPRRTPAWHQIRPPLRARSRSTPAPRLTMA